MTAQIKQDINALVEPPRQSRSLPPVEPVGGYPAQRGLSTYTAAQAASGGGGIDGPLTEPDYDARTYHEPVILTGDFLVAIELKPLKQISMTDRGGAPVVFNYDYKPEEP